MSKTKTRGKSASKKAAPEAPQATPQVDQLEQTDFLTLKVAHTELQNRQLLLREAARQFEEAKKEFEETQLSFHQQLNAVNSKYNLDPTTDKIDLANGGRIERGQLQQQG